MTDASASGALDPAEFAQAFKAFLERIVDQAARPESEFARRLTSHFGTDPIGLPVVSANFALYDHPNLQLALDAWLANASTYDLAGVSVHPHQQVTLSELITNSWAQPGPVATVERPVGVHEVLACLEAAMLYVTGEDGVAVALFVHPTYEGMGPGMAVEVMAPSKDVAAQVLATLRRLMVKYNVYRNKVVSLGGPQWGQTLPTLGVTFHRLAGIRRDDLVLAEGVLERIERHTLAFSRHRDKLLASGRHLKRGLLLHGPPGTGKTLTVTYLLDHLTERTVLLLAGQGLGAIADSCAIARALQPSAVVLEDVDLVAEERSYGGEPHPLLFQLLNEMDGLEPDADVIFLLTTNRADRLEPALAARPGRVDLAVRIPLPNAECRRRLLELYARGLDLDMADWSEPVVRSEGASGAFIKEWLRKAALAAAEEGDGPVTEGHVLGALDELHGDRDDLTATLLGAHLGRQTSEAGAEDPVRSQP